LSRQETDEFHKSETGVFSITVSGYKL